MQSLKNKISCLSINKKINLAVLLITLVITTSIGIFSCIDFQNTSIRIIGGNAMKIADSITANIDGDSIAAYNKTGKTDANWTKLVKYLSNIKAKNGAYYIYIMTDDGDKYKYIAEAHLANRTDDISKLGDTDNKSEDVLEPEYVLKTGKSTYTGITDSDAYGKLISGYSPIKDKNGNTVAFLGVDISAKDAISSIISFVPKLAVILIISEILLFLLLRALLKNLILKPLKDITELEKSIASGNYIEINEKYLNKNDEIGDMYKGFNSMSQTFKQLLTQIQNLSAQHKAGNIDVFIDENRFRGIYKDVAKNINGMAKAYLSELEIIIDHLDNISNGDFNAELQKFPGQKAFINKKINLLKLNLKSITNEMNSLVSSAIEGNLENRVNAEAFKGDWQKLMLSLNSLLDNTVEPIIESSKVLNELAKGNIDVTVNGEFNGSYAQIKDSLDKLTVVIGSMTGDVKAIAAATIDGNLAVRADESKYSGEYKKIMEYMNNTVDAVQKPVTLITKQLNQMSLGIKVSKIDENFKGTYAVLAHSINALTESVNLMFEKTNSLMLAAKKGDLHFRADLDGLQGQYSDIVACINEAMDAVIVPIEEISEIIGEISEGDLSVRVDKEYQGSINILKDNVNRTIDTLNDVIKNVSEYTGYIASGNVDLEELPAYNGDFNKISISLNAIVSSLNEVLIKIKNSSEQIAAGSSQLAESSRSLSVGASEQASSIEELTASISEIASQTESNAQRSAKAGELADLTKLEADSGTDKMSMMLKAMSEINESSQSINNIIKTIDDIAFQTNILALNAAIEAARAGQYGKGFAVVADEVRSLAAKSSKAAKDTGELIETSNARIKQGSDIVNEMASSLHKMRESIERSDELVSGIVTASKEQAEGISQINKGIAVVSGVIQTNAATSEETSAFSEKLSDEAETLKEMVGRFKFKN